MQHFVLFVVYSGVALIRMEVYVGVDFSSQVAQVLASLSSILKYANPNQGALQLLAQTIKQLCCANVVVSSGDTLHISSSGFLDGFSIRASYDQAS